MNSTTAQLTATRSYCRFINSSWWAGGIIAVAVLCIVLCIIPLALIGPHSTDSNLGISSSALTASAVIHGLMIVVFIALAVYGALRLFACTGTGHRSAAGQALASAADSASDAYASVRARAAALVAPAVGDKKQPADVPGVSPGPTPMGTAYFSGNTDKGDKIVWIVPPNMPGPGVPFTCTKQQQ